MDHQAVLYFISLAAAGAVYILINTYFVVVKKYVVRSPVKNPFTFVHITDIHGTIRFLNGRLSDRVNREAPDFVVLTGDLSNTPAQLPRVLEELEKIRAPHGIVAVPGNYEGQECRGFRKKLRNKAEAVECIRRTKNMVLLQNAYHAMVVRHNRIGIYGFDNSLYGNERYREEETQTGCDYKIMLAHSPSIIHFIEDNGIRCDQVLAGHTHGGQINLFWNGHLGEYKDFHVGARTRHNILFCISRGLGTVKIPVRLHCFPEICMYTIVPEN